MEKWYKYEYVCPYCDSLVTYTTRNERGDINPCPICPERLTLMSVVDATIYSTQQKEEQNMETTTETLPQVMKLDWVENDVVTTKEYTESDVRHIVWQAKNLTSKQNEWFRKESQLRTLLEEVYVDSSEQEVLSQIADIFDVPLTKEIEVTAWVRVDMTIEVELGQDVDSLDDFISSNLTVDSYGSEIQVNNHEIERVEEGSY
jgi:hypothetical protein